MPATLLFVDVDGVLNVSIRTQDGAMFLLTNENARRAARMVKRPRSRHSSDSAERITSVWNRALPLEGDSTYATLACEGSQLASSVLTQRLAQLIQISGEGRVAVLSSSWRQPSHADQLLQLEDTLSGHLGEPFTFDAGTRVREEVEPGDRLLCLGDFVASHCEQNADASDRELRVLVLDDFFASAFGWRCNNTDISSVEAAQEYLITRAPPGWDVVVKVVHTYDECKLPNGSPIRIGCGLTRQRFRSAARFLRTTGSDHDALDAWGEEEEAEDMSDDSPEVQDSEHLVQIDGHMPRSGGGAVCCELGTGMKADMLWVWQLLSMGSGANQARAEMAGA